MRRLAGLDLARAAGHFGEEDDLGDGYVDDRLVNLLIAITLGAVALPSRSRSATPA
jgi:hypothetical protein